MNRIGYLCSSNSSLDTYSLYSVGKWYSSYGTHRITSSKAGRLIQKGFLKNIIDVRSDIEWSDGHYENAKHIPITNFNENSLKNNNIVIQDQKKPMNEK